MATRFYLPNLVAPPVTPAVDASWEQSGSLVRSFAATAKTNTAMASLVVPGTSGASGQRDVVVLQLVSSMLAAGAITGTVLGQIRVAEQAAANDYEPQLVVRVVKPDGTTRGTLLASDAGTVADAHEFATALTNRQFPRGGAGTLSSVTAVAGDVLVIEIGFRILNALSTTQNATFRVGDPTGSSDLAQDETTTTDDAPWIEFSQTLSFLALGAHVSQEAAEVLNAGQGKARVSQEAVEVLNAGRGKARVSQVAVEVLRRANQTTAGVSQLALEVLLKRPPVRTTQVALEVLEAAATISNRVSQVALEVLERTRRGVFVTQIAAEVLRKREVTGTGPGNGGELFRLQLAPNGTSSSATLASSITAFTHTIALTGTGGLPAAGFFVLTIDDEAIYVTPIGGGDYRILHRALSNTAKVNHTAGATATWTDHYDMAIVSTVEVAADFFFADDSQTYLAWLIAFDSTQAYFGGDRYAAHVAQLLGVFPPDTGAAGTNRLDAAQPSAIAVPEAVTDDCPAGMTVPARIATNVQAGDVGLVRYTNSEAAILELGSRSCALQAWYGFKRVNDTDTLDVSTTDPTGNIVDGTTEAAFHDETFITTTLPGTDRTFTYGPPRYSEKGWPIAALAIRQGIRRIPRWTSPDWHNFLYVFSGWAEDATYVQIVVNRNGLVFGPDPEVTLPGPQDIDGPNATWDDNSYNSSTAWDVVLFGGLYIFLGPLLNPPAGGPSVPIDPGSPVGIAGPGGSPALSPPSPVLEGGEGGGIEPTFPEAPRLGVHLDTEAVSLHVTNPIMDVAD